MSWREDLDDLQKHRGWELECPWSARQKTEKNCVLPKIPPGPTGIVNGLLDDVDTRHDSWHQLFRHLRCAKNCTREAGCTTNLEHFDNLLGNRRIIASKHATSWSTICGTGLSRSMGTSSQICSTVRYCTLSCGPRGSPRHGARGPWGRGASGTCPVQYFSCLPPGPVLPLSS